MIIEVINVNDCVEKQETIRRFKLKVNVLYIKKK